MLIPGAFLSTPLLQLPVVVGCTAAEGLLLATAATPTWGSHLPSMDSELTASDAASSTAAGAAGDCAGEAPPPLDANFVCNHAGAIRTHACTTMLA